MATTLVLEERRDGVARVTLNRPGVHNAFDDVLIGALTARLEAIAKDEDLRAVVLTGAGKSFSAGADMSWMQRSAGYGEAENLEDARALARLMRALNELPKPTIAMVNGAAIGGGAGLVACCDIAVASDAAVFSLAEVRLGLIPAVIGPYVLAAIGPRQARRMFLTGERIGAAEAKRIGLVHDVVPAMYLESAVERVLQDLLKGGPKAQGEAKTFLREIQGRPIDGALIEASARRIAALRITAEAQEGLSAFLHKRDPAWTKRR